MNRYILSFITITIVLSWTINTSDQCVCSQWSESLCTIGVGCQWNLNSASCQNYSCAAISFSICNQVPYCYYNGLTCINFSSCSSVPYNNQTACNKVHGCQYYSGTTCSAFSCQNYSSNSTACTQNWQCIYTNGQCVQATTCSQYSGSSCPVGQYCYLNGQVCNPATCSSLSVSDCTFIYTTLSGNQIEPCISNGNECVEATGASQFTTENNCFAHTDNLYYWYYEVGTSIGECTSCSVTNPSLNSVIISLAMILYIS